jgi:hypothetical protein
MTKDEKNVSVQAEKCGESVLESIKRFFRNQRNWLAELQEAQFDRGERELVALLKDESIKYYPVPTYAVAFLAWLFVLLFPLILILDPTAPLSNDFDVWNMIGYYVPLLATMIIFFVNLRLLVPKFFFRKKYFSYFVCNSVLLAISLTCREFVVFLMLRNPNESLVDFFATYCFRNVREHFSIWTPITFFIILALGCLTCIAIVFVWRSLTREFVLREKRRTEMAYELTFLKQQLSPHFLFNTLNNITSLIRIDPSLAEKSMTELSQLLHMMLYQTADQYISVKEDVEILGKYADLEKLRLDENFDLKFEVRLENPQTKVAPLVMMPLMENAMKHCVNPDGKSFAHIFIEQKDDVLYFRAENSNFPRKSKSKSSGLGLATFQKRLELMYKDRYTYTTKIEDGVYISELKVKLEK